MMKLLQADGAWLAIGISVFFIVAAVAMKQVIVRVLKHGAPESEPESLPSPAQSRQHD